MNKDTQGRLAAATCTKALPTEQQLLAQYISTWERLPCSTSPEAVLHSHLPSTTTTRLYGRWLIMARLGTIVLVVLTVAALLPLLPAYITYLSTVCVQAACPLGQLTPSMVHALQAVGLSTSAFVAYTLALTLLSLLMCWSVATVIFWRKSDDWMALAVACMLVLMGTSYVTHLLLQSPSLWQIPALLLNILTFGALFLVFCLFPSGRFIPSWLHWLPVSWIAWGLVMIYLHGISRFYSLYLVGFLCELIAIVGTQVYRYNWVSTPADQVGRLGCLSSHSGGGSRLLARSARSGAHTPELALLLARCARAYPGPVPGLPVDWHGDPALSSLGH